MRTFQNKTQYLNAVLDSYRMGHIRKYVQLHFQKAESVKRALSNHFDLPNSYQPFYIGSYMKSTAINTKFELGILVPFPEAMFANLEEMGKAVEVFFKRYFMDQDLHQVSPNQHWSVGLNYVADLGHADCGRLHLEVVPGREKTAGCYADDSTLWFKSTADGSRVQTNVQAQTRAVRDSREAVRRVVRLLKIWKCHTGNRLLRSFMLELFTMAAFAEVGEQVPQDLWKQLEMSLGYIHDHVKQPRYRLEDPGNRNNNVLDNLTQLQRARVKADVGLVLETVKGREKALRDFFPPNDRFVGGD